MGRYCPTDACEVCGRVPEYACIVDKAHTKPEYPVLKTEDVSGKLRDLPRLEPKP